MTGAAVAAAVLAAAGPALASGGGAAEAVPTFTKDVAPILFDNCVTCHRSGNIAPMSLTSYAETRPWARSIKDLVPDNSLAFRNERRLDQAQIDTIAAWVDGGAPRGLAADLPALPDFPEGWTYEGGDPDYVFELPVEYTVAAEGEEDYLDFYSAMPWEEDRFAEVLELRPSNYAVVHHSGAYVVDLPAGKMVVDGVLVDDPNAAEEAASGAGRVAQRVFNQAGNAFPTDPFGADIYIVEGEEIKPARDADGTVRRAKIPNMSRPPSRCRSRCWSPASRWTSRAPST